MPLAEWLSFLLIALTITVSPGPGGLLTLTLGATRGPRAALISAFGLVAGAAAHVFIASALFSALLAGRPALSAWVMLAGGAYLLKLAIDSWTARGALAAAPRSGTGAIGRLVAAGAAVSLGNAKLIALLAALIPAFAGPEPSLPRASILALSYAGVAYAWHGVLAFAGRALGGFLTSEKGVRAFRRCVAALFALFGAGLVTEAALLLAP